MVFQVFIKAFDSLAAEMLAGAMHRYSRMPSIFDVLGITSSENAHAIVFRNTFCTGRTKERSGQLHDILRRFSHVFLYNLCTLSAVIAIGLAVVGDELLPKIS